MTPNSDRIAQLEWEVTDLQERLNSARDLIKYIVRREHVTREVYDGAMRWLANVPEVPKTVRIEDRAHDPRPCAVCSHSELEFTELKAERDTLQAELDRYQTAIRQGLWGDEAPNEPHGTEIFAIRREVVKLQAELAHEQELVNEYDDLLPVSWQTNALLDRHNDVLAYFDQETEDEIKDRIVSRINRKATP